MKFRSIQEAAEFILDHREDTGMALEAWDYIMTNAPPDLLRTLREGMRKFFPDLKPTHYDDSGNAYFEVGEIAEQLGMTVDEILDDMPEDFVLRVSENELNKVQ